MKLIFTPIAQEHWEYWKKNDPNMTKRIKKLPADILEHPYTGIGKPEPLKYELAGKWSRRINSEHRLIYSVHDDMIEVYIFSMKYHYYQKVTTLLHLMRRTSIKLGVLFLFIDLN